MSDYYNDPAGVELARITKLYSLGPGSGAKEAAEDTAVPSLRDYAWPDKSRYPVDSPGRTLLSWCYAKEATDLPTEDVDRVLGAIKAAADFWGVTLPVRAEDPHDEGPAVAIKVASGGREDTYTVDTPDAMLQLVGQLRKSAGDQTYDARRQLAEQVLAAPGALRALLSPEDILSLQRTAGDALVTGSDVKAACADRAMSLEFNHHPALAALVREAGDTIKADTIVGKEAVVRVSRLIDYATRAAGLKAAADTVPVEDMLAGIPNTEVARFTSSVLALKNGSAVPKSAIVGNRQAVDEFFAKLAGEDVSKLAEPALFDRVAGMDLIEADAFANITGLALA